MYKIARLFTTILVFSMVALLPRAAVANVDSFFDIFYDASWDQASGAPVISAQGVVRVPGSPSRNMRTELLSMSMSSHSPKQGISRHVVTLSYAARNIGSSGQDGVRGFAELDVLCRSAAAGAAECVVQSAKPLSKNEHNGHVTVLK